MAAELELACPFCHQSLRGETAFQCRSCGYRLDRQGRLYTDSMLSEPVGFQEAQVNHLMSIEQSHFWFAARDLLLRTILKRLINGQTSCLEIGCGTGRLLRQLERLFPTIAAVEPQKRLFQTARDSSSTTQLVQAQADRLPFAAGQFDCLVSFDVLEHVDDRAMLWEARRVATPNAVLLLSVPAFMGLWSVADELAGHRCRYRPSPLRELLFQTGWTPLGHTFYQCLLFPLVWGSRRLLAMRGRQLERYPGPLLSAILGWVNRREVAITSRITAPFGTSLIIWAQAL